MIRRRCCPSSIAKNVKGLVYVASFGLDQGVSALESVEGFPASDIGPALRPRTYPSASGEPGTELSIDPELFPAVFAGDLPIAEASVMAYSQRLAADLALGEPLAVEPGWKRLPSWFIVAGTDHAIDPDSERAAAQRMEATTVEIDGGSHAIALSQATRVTGVILDTVNSTRAAPNASVPA